MTIQASIDLTPEQLVKLEPLFAAVRESAANKTFGAILGQAWNVDDGPRRGTARFHYLTPAQAVVVDAAIIEAMKIK